MFFAAQITQQRDGKGHTYWSLVETIRTAMGPRQKERLCYLGELNSSAQHGGLRTLEVFEMNRAKPSN